MKNYDKRITVLKIEIEELRDLIESVSASRSSGYIKRLNKILDLKEKKLGKWMSLTL